MFFIVLPCLLVFSSSLVLAQPGVGDTLPPCPLFSLNSPQNRSERDYLGIPEGENLSVNQRKSDLFVIEIFSMNCLWSNKLRRNRIFFFL